MPDLACHQAYQLVHIPNITSNPPPPEAEASEHHHANSEMTGSQEAASSSPSPPPSWTARSYFRPKVSLTSSSTLLRQATLVLPKTGQRVKRTVTLRESDLFNGPSNASPSLRRAHALRRGESQSSPKGRASGLVHKGKDIAKKSYGFVTSKTGQGILKCSVAYFLGSLATFVPPIARFLGQQDGKHMVATITVYFHPARSQGSMHEATFLAIVAFLYAVFISFTSMGVSVFFGDRDLKALGHAIVLIVFCGGGLGLVGWLKQRLENPLVNVAASLTSLAIITVLTKEGAVQEATFSIDKIFQVMKMVVMGIIATTAVSLLVRPISARNELREAMIKATDSLGDMLTMITRSFLAGSEEELQEPSFNTATSQFKGAFASLTKNLKEAKYEHYVVGTEKEYQIEVELFNSMERLAHNVGGLRSAAATQFALLSQVDADGESDMPHSTHGLKNTPWIASPQPTPLEERYGVLASIDEAPENESAGEELQGNTTNVSDENHNMSTSISKPDIFSRFIMHLGPSMKSLAFTLKQILNELPYGPGPQFEIVIKSNFKSSLIDAIDLYAKARAEALILLYKSKDMNKDRPIEVEADFEEVAASCGHFSSSLQDFAEEMKCYLDILEELKLEVDREPRQRSWEWLKFWRSGKKHLEAEENGEQEPLLSPNQRDTLQQVPVDSSGIGVGGTGSISPEKLTYRYRVGKALRMFEREDVRFAIRVGAGAALYALPSFLTDTRPIYSHWRGEWGLLSYMLVCSMTIGASNTTGYQRFLGTCIGAVCAILAWIIAPGNPYALSAIGWFVSLGCFYIIIGQGKGPMGRFILLTYNLSALYAYSLSAENGDDDDDEGGINPHIVEITLHRVVAVMTGCLWGMIITRLIWPISARRKLKDGLSILWLRMGIMYKRDPLSVLMEDEANNKYMETSQEFELQRYLRRLETLRKAAAFEFDLSGPFPGKIYDRILESTASMLNAFHAMNVVIMKDLRASEGEAEILKYTAEERAQLCNRISHLFQVLASSMKIEYPLNNALPSTDYARDRLLAKLFSYRKIAESAKDEDFALLYAYVLVTGQLSREIEKVSAEIKNLFNIWDEDTFKLE
ncbi:MAG: hypothetical protein M1819_000981 [Sarea resinae]|nr:MAG: hypothetical protein M1819_000981 [Sarea resinae]